MLTEKPWRVEAIARLLAGFFICAMLGALGLAVIRFDPATAAISTTAFYLAAGGAALALLGALMAIATPWKLERFKLRAAVFIVCCYAGLTLAGLAQKSSPPSGDTLTVAGMIAALFSFQGAALPFLWIFTRQHGLTLREGFGFDHHPGHALLLGATVALCFIPVGLGLQIGIAAFAKKILHIELAAQDAVTILRLTGAWGDRVVLGVFTVAIAPLAEEGLFRGIFYPAIKRFGFPGGALWGTSLLFALIHFNILSFVPLVVLAIVLVKLYERTGNLLACIACHATFNAFNFVMLFVMKESGGKLGT